LRVLTQKTPAWNFSALQTKDNIKFSSQKLDSHSTNMVRALKERLHGVSLIFACGTALFADGKHPPLISLSELTESSKGIQMVSFPAVCLRKPAASEPTQY
jgi:hypothetical protein